MCLSEVVYGQLVWRMDTASTFLMTNRPLTYLVEVHLMGLEYMWVLAIIRVTKSHGPIFAQCNRVKFYGYSTDISRKFGLLITINLLDFYRVTPSEHWLIPFGIGVVASFVLRFDWPVALGFRKFILELLRENWSWIIIKFTCPCIVFLWYPVLQKLCCCLLFDIVVIFGSCQQYSHSRFAIASNWLSLLFFQGLTVKISDGNLGTVWN